MQDSAATAAALDVPRRGIAFVLLAISVFSVQDVAIKWMSGGYSVFEIVFARSLVALGLILVIARFDGGLAALGTGRIGLHLLRGAAGLAAYTTFYLALAALPMADAVALFFVSPLLITALSVPLLGEPVGLRRWLAIGVGFLGVLIMLRPGGGVIEPAAGLAILAALFYAVLVMITRRLGTTDGGAAMAFYTTLVYLAATALWGLLFGAGIGRGTGHPSIDFLIRAWAWPGHVDLGLMVLCGVVFAIGFYSLSQAYRLARATVVVPFEYFALVWAVGWGYVFFDELPDGPVFLGMFLVVASGIYVIHREGLRGRRLLAGRGLRQRM